jgi:hypothetical protein
MRRIRSARELPPGSMAAAYLILIGFALSPLCWVSMPPLVDYPIYMARMWILVHAADTPALAQNYQPAWRLLPNLAVDLVVPASMRFLSLEAAGRLFIALTLVSLVLGTAALRRALQRRADAWPLVSLLFLYNGALFWSLLNFLFALGIVLLAFSLWVASTRWYPVLRLLVFSVLAALIFVLHLFAFGLYGLLVGSWELGQWWHCGPRRLRPLLALSTRFGQFVPALLLWAVSAAAEGPDGTSFGTLANKIYAASAPGYFGTPAIWLGAATLAFCLAAAALAWRNHALGIVPAMRWPLTAVAIAAVLMPTQLHGSSLADLRLPVALPFLIAASVEVGTVDRRRLAGFAAVALVLLGLRVGMVTESWRQTDRSFAEFRARARTIPTGARLLVVREPMPAGWQWPDSDAPSWIRPDQQAFDHMAALAIVDRSAFVPGMITRFTAIEPTARNAGFSAAQGRSLTAAELAAGDMPDCLPAEWSCGWPAKFDHLLWIDFGRPPATLPARLQTSARGSFFTLYRITGEDGDAPPG